MLLFVILESGNRIYQKESHRLALCSLTVVGDLHPSFVSLGADDLTNDRYKLPSASKDGHFLKISENPTATDNLVLGKALSQKNQ